MWIFALLACSPTERIDVDIETSEVPVISWDRGPAHEVFVVACEGDCGDACLLGEVHFSGPVVWSVGYDTALPVEEAAAQEPSIESPLAYGESDVPGDARLVPAEPLQAGIKYGVQVKRLLPCTPPEAGCFHTESAGCSSFEIDG
jgi:hypothetical protein